jgi:hypothetical protein
MKGNIIIIMCRTCKLYSESRFVTGFLDSVHRLLFWIEHNIFDSEPDFFLKATDRNSEQLYSVRSARWRAEVQKPSNAKCNI